MSTVIAIQPGFKPASAKFEVSCATCNLRELCLPGALCIEDVQRVENIVYARRRVKRGEALFNAGAEFNAIYAIRSGFFKTSVLDGEGREQVTGFFMVGELLGLDGLGSGAYHGSAIALEDSEVCPIPFANLEEIARTVPALQHNLCQFVAREISHDHGVMLLLGSRRADERLASFLVSLSARYFSRGYSSTEFTLRMTREEIGSYLGLSLETVSRLFSRMQRDGLIVAQQKEIELKDVASLRERVGQW